MQNYFSTDFKIGILGGGQLGKMMLYDARKFDIATHVLESNTEAPSAIACNKFVYGDIQDYETVVNFGKEVDLITFEIEAVNLQALKKLEELGKTVYPSSATLELIQSKQRQKNFYKENHIPTSPFINFESLSALKSAYQNNEFKLPQVWKVATGGYDGKGVQVLKTEKDFEKLADAPCLIEELIDFDMELAVIVARNPSGETKSYPVVEMEFHPEANQVEYVLSPARISDETAQKARDLAEKVSQKFEHVGLLAIEFFLTKDGEILVNEVAPRPHNSGHLTIEGNYTNQFEQHLRSILDLPLGDSSTKKPAVMVNLVGDENYEGQVVYKNIDQIFALKGVTPHIYGKKQTRPFRKMGHVTIINESIEEARTMAEKVKKQIKVIADEKL